MPRNETILNVFVASPSDVFEERKTLESVVQELNKTWSKKLELRLELIKWETDVHPGFADNVQEVINEQINDEYDIFIAIFWSRLGTPTKETKSGTVEEFDRAYRKHKKNKDDVDIMVYFKDQAIPPSKMDFKQLKDIQELQNQLGEKGGLYWTFDSTADFESLLRVHLSKVAQKWASKSLLVSIPDKEIHQQEENNELPSNEFEDYGLLDYIDIYESRMSEMTSSLEVMANATERIGNQFTLKTDEINEIGSSDKVKTRKLIKLISHDMDRYYKILNTHIDLSSKSREEAFFALSMALSVYVDFIQEDESDEGLDGLEESLVGLEESTAETFDGLKEFQTSLINLPRLTVDINKSKRLTVQALDRVLEEIEITNKSTTDVLQSIGELKENIKT